MLALTLLAFLGSQLLRYVTKLCKQILLVRSRLCTIHVGLLAMPDFEDIDECWGMSISTIYTGKVWEYALAVSFVSKTSISFSGQQRSATSLSLSDALRRRRLRATSTASSRSTNRTALMGLYVAALSANILSTSAMTCRPGVVGTNFAEPSIWACKLCI